eukprot:CAMPEP_0181365656 /NCGR_PEP_ID=MMETSP1106-20121128/10208_1 /TAXON_ID=81844 /ORGANISM="Mantoniella antarctica, Strain SL-175" /LENGTH=386 /DNA_ID=CAMNT_0023480795 /DNA_START=228 /DNA_END=1384 /DNA_ORIENTATION=-
MAPPPPPLRQPGRGGGGPRVVKELKGRSPRPPSGSVGDAASFPVTAGTSNSSSGMEAMSSGKLRTYTDSSRGGEQPHPSPSPSLLKTTLTPLASHPQQQQQQLMAHLQNATSPAAPPNLRVAALRSVGAACQSLVASEVSAVAAAAAAASGGVPTNKTGSSLFFDWVTAKIGLPLVSGPGGVVRGQDLQGKAAAMEAACACLAPILARVSPPATASTANPATAAAFDGPSSTQLTSLVAPRIPSLVAACQAALDDPHTPPELLPPLLRLISVVARKPKWLFHPPPPSPPPPLPSLAVGATVACHPSSSLVSESLKSAEGAGSATAAAAADASSSHSASSGASFKDFADALLAWAVDRDTPEPIRRQTVSLLGRFGGYWVLHHGFTA